MKNFEDLGNRFINYMKINNIGVNKMAKKLNFSGSQISNIRNGKVFGADKLFKILNTYKDIDANWLIKGEQSQNNINDSKYIELLEDNIRLRKKVDKLKEELLAKDVKEKGKKRRAS